MKKLFFIIVLVSTSIYAQSPKIDSLLTQLKNTEEAYEVAKINLTLAQLFEKIDLKKGKEFANKAFVYKKNDSLLAVTNTQIARFYFFSGSLDSASFHFKQAKNLLKILNDENGVASLNISLGAIQLRQGNYNKTIKTLTESAVYFEKQKDVVNAAKCYSNIASAFAELENYPKAIDYSEKALKAFSENKLTQYQLITLPNLATQYYKNGDTIKAINYYNEAEKLGIKLDNKRSLSMTYNNLGDIYLKKNPSLAKDYLEKAINLKNELNLKSGIEFTQSNLGYIHLQNKEYNTAISYFKQAALKVKGKQLVHLYNNIKESYKGIGNMTEALLYSEKSKKLNDSILDSENQNNLNNILTKYETEAKEKEILELKTENLQVDFKRKQNRNLLIATLFILGVSLIIVYMLLKIAKRKKTITQQNLIIKDQQFNQLLKTQELNAIDAIIETQEKERTRIANDLHDNLGSKIATLKLYIEDFKSTFKKSETKKSTLLDKIGSITDDTYNEVRKIAHNKNFGNLIEKGLIFSTKNVAQQISNSNKISIKVINIDVKRTLENNIEIQIFRSIQELLTNCIKHSKASEVIIQFSEHENELNVMVEDNGIGFQKNKTKLGHGLTNIEKRMERIKGDISIDSTEGNGTTIILNIPL
ncbi:MAG: sensor histidine kinase [Flavobacteriaceae bacterium]|nr:sensor histidine kinase [Flavobacteriaceae bacterium]